GDSMVSISYAFRIALNIVSVIINETCESIWNVLKHRVFLQPSSSNWEKVADDFERICNPVTSMVPRHFCGTKNAERLRLVAGFPPLPPKPFRFYFYHFMCLQPRIDNNRHIKRSYLTNQYIGQNQS
ncbi:hypothetical protein ALC60_07095, partial [Trachymyrmex zeteki]